MGNPAIQWTEGYDMVKWHALQPWEVHGVPSQAIVRLLQHHMIYAYVQNIFDVEVGRIVFRLGYEASTKVSLQLPTGDAYDIFERKRQFSSL
jgi:hypothetical protein